MSTIQKLSYYSEQWLISSGTTDDYVTVGPMNMHTCGHMYMSVWSMLILSHFLVFLFVPINSILTIIMLLLLYFRLWCFM